MKEERAGGERRREKSGAVERRRRRVNQIEWMIEEGKKKSFVIVLLPDR